MVTNASTIHELEAREPGTGRYTLGRSRHKQVARIVCHLRDELHGSHPQLRAPTRGMIERLVFNACSDETLQCGDWDTIVITTLKNIRHLASASPDDAVCKLTQQPLFPNDAFLDEWDVFRFCQVLLGHLETLSIK